MNGKKPGWVKTNIPWETKKIVWQRWALGDTEPHTVQYFEQHSGEHDKPPFNRDTVSKVRDELLALPLQLTEKLLNELPEIRSLVEGKRPDLKEELGLPRHDITQQDRGQKIIDPSIISYRNTHFEELCQLVQQWKAVDRQR